MAHAIERNPHDPNGYFWEGVGPVPKSDLHFRLQGTPLPGEVLSCHRSGDEPRVFRVLRVTIMINPKRGWLDAKIKRFGLGARGKETLIWWSDIPKNSLRHLEDADVNALVSVDGAKDDVEDDRVVTDGAGDASEPVVPVPQPLPPAPAVPSSGSSGGGPPGHCASVRHRYGELGRRAQDRGGAPGAGEGYLSSPVSFRPRRLRANQSATWASVSSHTGSR